MVVSAEEVRQEIDPQGEMSQNQLFQAEADSAHASLYYNNRFVLGFPDFQEKPQRQMCDFATAWTPGIDRKLFLLCRNSFKTSAISVGDSIWLLMNDPNETCLIVGEERSYAIKILGQIRSHMTSNEKLIEINGGVFRGPSGWRPEEIFIVGRTDLHSKEPSIGTAGIDNIRPGPHYGYIFVDDGESEKNTETDRGIEKLIRNYKYLSPMVRRATKNRRGGRIIFIGTPYNILGIYYYIIGHREEAKHYDFMFGQARKEVDVLPEIEDKKKRARVLPDGPEGTLLMPDIITKEILDDEEAKDAAFYMSQQQISLTAGASVEFQKEWFRYYLEDELPGRMKTYAMLDPAISLKSSADYTSIITIGQDEFDNVFILDMLRDRITPDEIIDYFYYLYGRFKPYKMGIETNGFQNLLEWIFNKEARHRGFLPTFPLPHYDISKRNRIRALIAPFKAGKIYFLAADKDKNRPHYSQRPLFSELIYWNPKKTSHDDSCDTLAMYLELAIPRRRKENKKYTSSGYRHSSSSRSGY